MKTAMMVYATDLVDEGVDRVLETLRDRAQIDGVELAAVYHHARDLYPHNPVHHLHFADGGACFFRPDASRHRRARIQPRPARLVEIVDPLDLLVTAAARHALTARAWTINLHNYALGEAYTDCAARNVFGDPLLTDLCPANPHARAYVRSINADIARYGVEAIVAESICYMPFEHGFHHERAPYPLGPTVRYFLSVCFCSDCQAAFRAQGVAPTGIREWVRRQLERAIAGEPSEIDDVPLERPRVAALAGGDMEGVLTARETVVSSLVAEVADAVHAEGSTRLVFMDSMPADDGGDQVGALLIDRSWRFGVDLVAVAGAADGISVLGYSRDDARFRHDFDAYRNMGLGRPLSLVLRAMPPDCYGPEELVPKVRTARQADVDWIEFYVYGLMRLSGLDWIGAALHEGGWHAGRSSPAATAEPERGRESA